MKKSIFLLIGIIFAIIGCSASSNAKNSKYATYEKIGNRYYITLYGKRVQMVHDPISMIRNKSYSTTYTLAVPRIEGVIKGDEIFIEKERKNSFKYVGFIKIRDKEMLISLEYQYFDNETPNYPLSWNGRYILSKKL